MSRDKIAGIVLAVAYVLAFDLERPKATFEAVGALARSECESSLGKGGQPLR